MTDTLPAPADAPEPKGQPCQDCGQVHDASALEGMTAQQLHDIATAALAQAAEAVTKAEPGKYPDVEKALQALNYTAREVLRERLLAALLGQGQDIMARSSAAMANPSARKSQDPTGPASDAHTQAPLNAAGPYL